MLYLGVEDDSVLYSVNFVSFWTFAGRAFPNPYSTVGKNPSVVADANLHFLLFLTGGEQYLF